MPMHRNTAGQEWMVAKGGIEPPTHGFSVALNQ